MSGQGRRPHGVSDRERDVLLLVADHLTNAEIADRLGLSVRTVESHVSSLIRKLAVADRRSLARRADALGLLRGRPGWPASGNEFVGREAESAELAANIAQRRMVTVTGPGGVGKTRLTSRVAEQASAGRADGGWFVDLAQVAEPRGVPAAVAEAIGVVEAPGGSVAEALVTRLRSADAVLLLDNCEHVIAGVERLVRRLVAECPTTTIVATSRARLGTSYEWVYPLSGLAEAEAVELFCERAVAAGGTRPIGPQVVSLCTRLEGMALAVELAAARYPSLGLDGLSAALDDPLHLLGAHDASRQRSLRATIDWSVQLLAEDDRAVFAACAVFASWFTARAARRVARPELDVTQVADALSRLADQHLLQVHVGAPTTYRFQEVVRQFAAGLPEVDAVDVARRHAAWAADELAHLGMSVRDETWCEEFDRLAVELRAALGRPGTPPALGESFATELIQRGRLEEAQHIYEGLVASTAADGERVRLLRLAAGAGAARLTGDEAMRLLDEAHAAALRAGDVAAAADARAWSVINASLYPGIMANPPPSDVTDRHLAEAQRLAPRGSSAAATVEVAAAVWRPRVDLDAARVARRAAAVATEAGVPLAAVAAWDAVCAAHIVNCRFEPAMAAVAERGRLLDPLPVDAHTAFLFNDYLLMGCELSLAVGDLRSAASFAERLAGLPCYRDYVHPPLARRLEVDVLSGDLDAAVRDGGQFLASWERAGRHRARTLAVGAHALAVAFGLLGRDRDRAEWLAVAYELGAAGATDADVGWAPALDALLLLHRDDPPGVLRRLSTGLDDPKWRHWMHAMWRPWYAASWAEALALSRDPGAESGLIVAARATGDNPVAALLVQRAGAILAGDRAAVAATATVLDGLGSSYQAARSRQLAR